MSRCFPYPPPNYCKEEISKSVTTDSIKLEKEQDLTKERRKEKRAKKERKEKRDKSKDKSESSKHREHGHKKRKHDRRNGLLTKDGCQKLAAKDVIEQLERSGLTEERGLPCPMQEPCESSESTQNSSKKSRKLEATNVTGGSHGSTILRLRFPFQKHRDPKPTTVNVEKCFSGRATRKDAESTPSNEEPCFSGQSTGAPMERDLSANAHSQYSSRIKSINKIPELLLERQFGDNFHGRFSAVTKSGMTSVTPMELERQPSATIKSSKPIEAPVERELVERSHSHTSSTNMGSKKTRELERQFRDLVMNWKALPFLLNSEPGTDVLEWLYEKSGQHSVSSDAAQSCWVSSSVEEPSHGSGVSSYQTRACYLAGLEMHQLPYIAPF